ASKVGLAKSTDIPKLKKWNKLTNSSNQGVFPETINKKEHKDRKVILKNVHTVLIFDLLIGEPT
ncbi:hypothetical protein BY458DRAFT_447555, partial [Sporodiniella umbellata]